MSSREKQRGALRGVAQSGSARALGAWGRRFKSSHPDQVWPRGQAVKTSPFHGGNRSSILLGVTISFWELIWAFSSVGQSSRLITDRSGVQVPEGPPRGPVVQLVSTPACHAGGQGFEPPPGRHFLREIGSPACWCSSMAEQLICNQ